ncbi:MAG TPA: DbpA RNA binding domain-containing protein [Gemmatimonadales bacterium]|nr:DbpA RNA binding domain-containing protein [Gemmatimonadales bacterium]
MTLADARAALERGRPVVLIRPPAARQAQDLWQLLGPLSAERGAGAGPLALVICGDDAVAAEWASVAPSEARAHAVTGLAHTARVVKDRSVGLLAGAAKDLAALVARAALKLDTVMSVVLAWPEGFISGDSAAPLDALLAETRDARRIVLSWNPALLSDFLERHARRPLVVGKLPVDEAGTPLPPVCRIRYAIVPPVAAAAAVRATLDTLNATAPFVWEGGPLPPPPSHSETRPDVVVCTALPTRDELEALARWGGGDPALLIGAAQLPYLRSIATLTPLPLPSGADRARDRAEALRERVVQVLTSRTVDAELALLDPLFQRFDPAEVAAALLALQRDARSGMRDAVAETGDVERVKLFVNVGKKDRVAAKDLVGALIREAGLAKGDIGRIEVRESFSLVEVAGGAAQRALQRLAGVTIRGRRVAARLDRDR